MKPADHPVKFTCEPTVFTVRLQGRVHRCAMSDAALYLLSQEMDPRLDRVEAYLLLKQRVAHATQACLDDSEGELPPLMEACHVLRHA